MTDTPTPRDVIENVPGFGYGETTGDAILSALTAAGYVVVPREPTLDMLEAGYEAMRIARVSGISGMTIDAQTRARCHREGNIYRAMISAAPTAEGEVPPNA